MPALSSRSFSNVIALEPARDVAGCTPPDAAPPLAPPREEVPTGVRHLAIMLTRKCNMSCAHCSVESGPKIKGEPTDAELLQAVREAHRNGVRSLLLTGGEPMLREKVLLEMLHLAQDLGLTVALSSNGFWGKTPERARATVARLKAAGLKLATISYDRYHADYQGPEPAVNIARAAGELGLMLNISITRTTQEDDLDAIVAPFAATPNANLRFYDVQPIGRARDFDKTTMRAETAGFCNACAAPALTDDGRLAACNGPSYFSQTGSPLVPGSTHDEPLQTLLKRHQNDVILEAIRTHGPQWLADQLETLPGFENWQRENYGGMCDVCLHVNSDSAATSALREHLSDPKLMAERAARRLVIEASRQDELNRAHVNGAGVTRIWWRALRDVSSLDGRAAETILGRADLDWSAQLTQLSQCGLCGPLLPALVHPALVRFAPAFWLDKMGAQAMADAMRALVQRDALREIAQIAREIGARGVLLKGAAMLALDAQTRGELPARACCDLDIYFAPAVAKRVHAALIQRGYRAGGGESTLNEASGHQLPALGKGAIMVEIHQTLLPQFCGLPEQTMLRSARALEDAELRGLRVLRPEAMLLHSALHCSKHCWSHGLKLAYDIAWICERFPALNWNWLARLVARTGMKRGFWTPFAIVARELELPVPPSFVARAPHDARARRLERLARRHLFQTGRSSLEKNAWIGHALYALQSDNPLHIARHFVGLARGVAALGRDHRAHNDAATRQSRRKSRVNNLRAALGKWRRL